MATKIQDLFFNDIKRDINGVIKVEQDDEANVFTELNEYVVTREALMSLDKFFENYLRSSKTPTEKMGLWISGDFGSGKSHMLKILSYLLENKVVKGKSALEFFQEKIKDPAVYETISNAVTSGPRDVILFRIDANAEQGEAISDILMREFNKHLGYYKDVFWIADLERELVDRGLYEKFKKAFLEIKGKTWESRRSKYDADQDQIIEALVACKYQSREALENTFNKDGAGYRMTPEIFVEKIADYFESKPKNQQLIFLIDELGQYVGDNSQLMLNLQTVTELLGVRLKGKVWIGVTSQVDMEAILKTMKGKEIRQDFSKIQGRFDTRISLSSANVDEVLKQRILRKKEEVKPELQKLYEENKIGLNNLITFSAGSAEVELKRFKNEEEFIDVYPFIPYQISVLQKVFEKIRTTGFTGKHLAHGERSMINSFTECGQKYSDEGLGLLVPFYSFYDTIESFLDPQIKRTILDAEKNHGAFDAQILKILFMIRHVKAIPATKDNIAVLALSRIDENKKIMGDKVQESLNRLLKACLIDYSGETYHFLTNEEQEISREINMIDIENSKILDEFNSKIFGAENKFLAKVPSKPKYTKAIDTKEYNSGEDLTIRFITPLFENKFGNNDQAALDGGSLATIDGQYSKDTLLFLLKGLDTCKDHIVSYLQIESYRKHMNSTSNDELMAKIIAEKVAEAERLKKDVDTEISDAIVNATVYVDCLKTPISATTPAEKIKEGYELLVRNVFSKQGYVDKDYDSDSEILQILRSNDLEKFGLGKNSVNSDAVAEILDYLQVCSERKQKLTLGALKTKYIHKPYGWNDMTISGLVAQLFVSEEIKLRYQMTYLTLEPETVAKYLTKKDFLDKLFIEIRSKSSGNILSDVKTVLANIFDINSAPEKESELQKIAIEKITQECTSLDRYLGYCDDNEQYPGHDELVKYSTTLKNISGISDPTEFFAAISTAKQTLIDAHNKAEPAMAFYSGQQFVIFKEGLKKNEEYTRNISFIADDVLVQEAFQFLSEILSDKHPYSKIKQMRDYESVIDSYLEKKLAQLKMEYETKAKSYCDQILGMYPDLKETDEIPAYVLKTFNSAISRIQALSECLVIDKEISDLSELYAQVLEAAQRLDAEHAKDGDETPECAEIEVIKSTDVFRSKHVISSDEELDAYLAEVKKKLAEILKSKRIQVI